MTNSKKKNQKYDIESLWYLERNINYTKSCTKLRFYTRYNISLTMDYEKKSNTPTVLRPVEFSGRNKKKNTPLSQYIQSRASPNQSNRKIDFKVYKKPIAYKPISMQALAVCSQHTALRLKLRLLSKRSIGEWWWRDGSLFIKLVIDFRLLLSS